MGLDITAYSGLVPVADSPEYQDDPPEGTVRFHEGYFPERAEGVRFGVLYSYEGSHSFRAGSYIGYNRWRSQLAQLVGHGEFGSPGPFAELIDFTDCDGVIGRPVAVKLARDFADFNTRALAFTPDHEPYEGYWYKKYDEFRKAFELASDRGAVSFH